MDRLKGTSLRWLFVPILLIVVGIFVYAQFDFHLNLSPITEKDLEPYAAVGKLLETIGRQPSQRVDDSSVGFPKREAELRILHEAVLVFQVRFHRLPHSLAELPQIIEDGRGAAQARRELSEASEHCRIFAFDSDSYALNCDGWKPDEVQADRAHAGFDQNAIKFYAVDRHVLIYVPSIAR